MNATTSHLDELATKVWTELSGSYEDRCKSLSILFQSLRNVRNDAKPLSFGVKMRQSEEEIVSKLIGRPITDVGATGVPICGITMKLAQVFAVAEHAGHPLQEHCKDFCSHHHIVLNGVRKSPTAKPTMYVVRKNDGTA